MTQFEKDTPQVGSGKTGGSLSVRIDIYEIYAPAIMTFYQISVLFSELLFSFLLPVHAVNLIFLYGNPHFLAVHPAYFPL